MKIKVVCVDCSASLDWEEDELGDFECPKCQCDDYNIVASAPKRKIVSAPKAPEFSIDLVENSLPTEEVGRITDTLGVEVSHNNGQLNIDPLIKEEEMEEEQVEINPIIEKQLGGLVTDLSSVLRSCDIPLNRVSFDYDVDDISVEVTIRRP